MFLYSVNFPIVLVTNSMGSCETSEISVFSLNLRSTYMLSSSSNSADITFFSISRFFSASCASWLNFALNSNSTHAYVP